MSAQGVAAAVLLSVGLAIEVVCAIGLHALRTVYDRIHLLGPAAVAGVTFITAAVVVQEGMSPLGIKAMLVAIVMWASSPLLAHATARAARLRDRGTWLLGASEPAHADSEG